MPLIIEDEGKLLGKKQAKVPDKLVNKIKKNLNLFGKYKKSKGFKRANSIVDDDYNKRSNKKEKIHNGDKTLSFSDIKKIDHEFKNMSINDDDVNAKNLGFILPGGNDMKNWAHDTLRKMRTAVKKVEGVPPVPKLEKEPIKPKDVNKDIKIGSANVKLTETSHKKIVLNENQLLALKEYHDQTVFNFDNEGNAYFEKNNWENYVDFLEYLGTPGELPKSSWGMNEIYNAIEEAKNQNSSFCDEYIDEYNYIEAFLELVCDAMLGSNKNYKERIFTEEFLNVLNGIEEFAKKNNYYITSDVIETYLRNSTNILDDIDEMEGYLTPYGFSLYQTATEDSFYDNIYEYDMENNMIINDRGLIYIERNITIPKFNSPKFNYDGNKNFYNYLKKSFYDLGNCFSWEEGRGESYNGMGFGENGVSEIKLKCWVDPKDVNWEATVYRNCYSLRDEKEIYIDKSGAKVEVFDVILMSGKTNGVDVSEKSLLKTPIIINY